MVLQPVVFIETQMFQGDGRCYPKLFLQIFLGREHPDLGHPPPPVPSSGLDHAGVLDVKIFLQMRWTLHVVGTQGRKRGEKEGIDGTL